MIRLWVLGAGQSPAARALALLGAACPQRSRQELGALTLGQRDALLLQLRERLFGTAMAVAMDCPACRKSLELELSTEQLRVAVPADNELQPWQRGDLQLHYRLPSGADQLALEGIAEPDRALRRLLSRCIPTATRAGVAIAAADLPEVVIAELAQLMAEKDPQGEILLALTCPECSHGWQAILEVPDCLFQEISAHVRRLVHDVHKLASAYGWPEAHILQMSAQHRQLYLDLVGP